MMYGYIIICLDKNLIHRFFFIIIVAYKSMCPVDFIYTYIYVYIK